MAIQRGEQGIDPDGGGRIVGTFDVGRIPRRVVDDEVHVREQARHGHDVVGMVEHRIEVHEREALVGHEDLDAEVMGVLDRGKPDSRIRQGVALPRRAPGRVHLEPRNLAGGSGARHLVEGGAHGTHIRGDDVLDQESTGAAVGQPGQDLLGVHGVGERDRGHWKAPSSGRRSGSPPSVSLARNMSWR